MISRHYIPGIISLAALPLILVVFFFYSGRLAPLHSMVVIFTSPDLHLHHPESFPYHLYPEKLYTHFTIGENEISNDGALGEAQDLIREMSLSRDTTKGIHFHFSENSK